MNEYQIEPPLTHYYPHFAPYNKFNLYDGELVINDNYGNTEKVLGKIDFNYSSNPRIEISFKSNLDNILNFTTFHPDLDIPIECLSLKSKYNSREPGHQIIALIKSNPRLDKNLELIKKLIKVKFYLINFPYVRGRPIGPKGEVLDIWTGRYKLEVDEWRITIEKH